MSKLTTVANIKANPDKIEFVEEELIKLIEITRSKEGCINDDLHQDNENSAHFVSFENWESRELWQTHMNAPHLTAYMEATDGSVADFTLNEMTQVV